MRTDRLLPIRKAEVVEKYPEAKNAPKGSIFYKIREDKYVNLDGQVLNFYGEFTEEEEEQLFQLMPQFTMYRDVDNPKLWDMESLEKQEKKSKRLLLMWRIITIAFIVVAILVLEFAYLYTRR